MKCKFSVIPVHLRLIERKKTNSEIKTRTETSRDQSDLTEPPSLFLTYIEYAVNLDVFRFDLRDPN